MNAHLPIAKFIYYWYSYTPSCISTFRPTNITVKWVIHKRSKETFHLGCDLNGTPTLSKDRFTRLSQGITTDSLLSSPLLRIVLFAELIISSFLYVGFTVHSSNFIISFFYIYVSFLILKISKQDYRGLMVGFRVCPYDWGEPAVSYK